MNNKEKEYLYNLLQEIKPRYPTNPADLMALSECCYDNYLSLQLIEKAIYSLLYGSAKILHVEELKDMNKRIIEREIGKTIK